MTCNQAQQALLLKASGEIGFWRSRRLHRHWVGCPACRKWQNDLGRLTAVELPGRSIPLLSPTFSPAPFSPRQRVFPFAQALVWAAALALVLAGAGGWGWSRWNIRQTEIQIQAQVARLQEWTLLAAVMIGDDLAGIDPAEQPDPESARQALARQLLRLQELDSEDLAAEEGPTPSAQHRPTILPKHNRFADLSEKYG